MSQIKKLFVVGAGLMGRGISQVIAQAGYSVTMRDINHDILDRAMDSIRWSVKKLADKGIVKESPEVVLSRITPTTNLKEAEEADFVIEAIPEELDLKREMFSQLDRVCSPAAILATNTSAIPITQLAAVTQRPAKVVGTHFFSPVPMTHATEIIGGVLTAEETIATAKELIVSLKKVPISVKRDVAGFLMNRIGIAFLNEAMRLYEEGVGTAEDIDKGMCLGYGWTLGPLETLDLAGIDIMYNAALEVFDDTGDVKFKPPAIMHRMVSAGHLGRKTGRGFYQYDKDGKKITPQ